MREIKAIKGGRLTIKDGKVLMVYEKRITPLRRLCKDERSQG